MNTIHGQLFLAKYETTHVYCWLLCKKIMRDSVKYHHPKWFCAKPDGWAFSSHEVCCISLLSLVCNGIFFVNSVFTEWNVSRARSDLIMQIRLLNEDAKYIIYSSKYLKITSKNLRILKIRNMQKLLKDQIYASWGHLLNLYIIIN